MVKFRKLAIILISNVVLLVLLITGNLATTSLASPAISSTNPKQLLSVTEQPSIDFVQVGLCGEIETDIVTMELASGADAVLLGTSKGLYIVSEGVLLNYIPTSSPVVDIALPGDVNGDDQQDIVMAVWDTYFPNIRCYDSNTGNKLWQFLPIQEVFADNLMWTECQTLTFDIEALDINNDNIKDVIATSGYQVYAIDGKTGKQLWVYQASNNLWKIAVTDDFNADGHPDLAVGGQNGTIYALSSKDGKLLWQERVAEKYDVINDKNKVVASVDRSVWDVVPFDSQGRSQAVVSSEDGKVRLIDLADGTIKWETEIIEYVTSLQFDYYSQKSYKPTSPGEQNFFNLRVCMVDDITGDDIEEVLASAFLGEGRSGLFMINGASGQIVWQKPGLSLSNVSRVEVVSIGGEESILLPRGKTGFTDELDVIDLKSGATLRTIEVVTGPESASGNIYQVKGTGNDTLILASNYGDLLLISTEGGVLWDYPRVTDVVVELGEFCGDSTKDFLIRSRIYPSGNKSGEPTVRVLYVLDGATKEKAWSYEVPYEEFVATGGISSVQITPDLNGDGKQDIAGFIQIPGWKRTNEEYGENTRIILLSGRDGVVLLKQPVVDETYYGVWQELYQDPSYHEVYIRQWFELDLKKQLDAIEKDMRQKNVSEAGIRQNLKQEEEGRRRNFEQNDLAKQLENLQNRLEKDLQNLRIDKWISSFGVVRFREGGPAPVCFLVKTPRDIYILNPKGETVLTWVSESWKYSGPFGGETELPPGVKLLTEGQQWQKQLVLDDLNDDGGDDLANFTNHEIYITTTNIGASGDVDFNLFRTIEVSEGIDLQQVCLVDDLDGNGIRELSYYRRQENRPPIFTVVSPLTGANLIEVEYDSNWTLNTGCADFNGDGYADTLFFRKWVEGKEGPKIEILSGWDKAVIWEYNDYRDNFLFQRMNYQGSIMPACPISDITNDGVDDLAIIQNLTYQSGAQIILYDVARKQEIKRIVLEEIDPTVRRDEKWHAGLLVKEIEDVNGDGWKELAAIMPFGDKAQDKVWQLIVVDIYHDTLLADFQVFGSEFIELDSGSEFGMIGSNGEVYLLNVTQNLQIAAPVEGSTQVSPVTVKWTGAGETAFNQVFVDGIEVGRTNESELTVPVTQGEHELEVRSLDEYGRGIYQKVAFTVEKSSSPVIWLIILLVLFILIALVPAVSGIIIRQRHRRERHG